MYRLMKLVNNYTKTKMLLISCRLISSIFLRYKYHLVFWERIIFMKLRILLGQNIKKYRYLKGVSQEQLAELSGLHRTYIGAVERGERNISVDNIEKICNALEIHIKELFNE